MAHMYDYLSWRGDLSFSQAPVNEIDSLIFSTLAYSDFTSGENLTIAEHARLLHKHDDKATKKDTVGFFAEIPKLLQQVSQTKRFAPVTVHHFQKKLDTDESIQFAAMVFTVKRNLHVIAFRGTDSSLIGWKEDLYMSFMDEVAAQHHAADYVAKMCDELEGNFIVCGHSKGGNLAVYAAVKLAEKYRKRIRSVYNNDGPGFQPHVIESDSYRNMLKKISTFIPQSSIVGILLEHGGDYTAIESKQISILQHDPFSWKVEGSHFVRAEELSRGVLTLKHTIRSWLNQVSVEEREDFVKNFCDLIAATGAKTLEDLSNDKLQSAYAILKAYTHMDKDSKETLKKTMDLFFKESRKSFKETILEGIDQLLPTKKQQNKTIET